MVRNRIFISATIATVSVGLLAGCGTGAGSSARANTDTTFTPKQGDTVPAHVGKQFVVKLESNPTTGYEWAVKQTPPVVKFISSSYQAPAAGGEGAPGEQVLTFQGVKEGSGDIALAYERPFAPGEPGKQLTFRVDVSG